MAVTWAELGIDIRGRQSGEVKAKCPRCSHLRRKHASDQPLSVNVSEGVWHCHHCEWKGSLEQGGQGGMTTRYGAPLHDRADARVFTRPAPPPSPDERLEAVVAQFFSRRGISMDTVRDAHVTWAMDWMPQFDGQQVQTIQFPYERNGEVVNIKYRARDKSFRMARGAERIFYGLDWCREAEQVVIVEGELDALALREAGITAVLSVPDGAPKPPKPGADASDYAAKFSFIESGAGIFGQCHSVIIATDMDEPGRYLAEELARRIGYLKCYIVDWPAGCKDANDVLLAHGAEGLRAAIGAARPYPMEGIIEVDALYDAVLALRDKNGLDGALVGFPSLERLYRPGPTQFTVVTGVPGSGKSKLVDAMAMNLAAQYGWRFGVCSPENWPPELHLRQLLEYRTGRPLKGEQALTAEEIRREMDWIRQHITLILPETMSLEAILERAAVLVFRHGINGLIIDPWTELEHSRPKHLDQSEYVAQALSQVRRFARENRVHVWIVAHPSKMQKLYDEEGKAHTPVVDPYSVRGSAAWFDKADFMLSVYRDKDNPAKPIEVHVAKVRHRDNGEIGVAKLWFDPATYRYRDAR